MKYTISYLLCIACFCGFPAKGFAEPVTLEVKAGAFIPYSHKMRKIFSTAMPFVELEGSYEFFLNWDAWAGVGYIFATGNSISCGGGTSIDVVPITLGVTGIFHYGLA